MTNIILFMLAAFVFYMLYKNITRISQNSEGEFIKEGNREKIDSSKMYATSVNLVAQSEAGLIVSLIAKVAKADGRVSELEAELISNALEDLSMSYSNQTEARGYLKEVFNNSKNLENIESITDRLYQITYDSYNKRVKIVEFLINIAFIDGELASGEEAVLKEIASGLKIRREDFERFFASFENFYKHRGETQKDTKLDLAYELLKSSKDDSDEEIKRKYKEAVKKYHPDIIRGKGLEEDFVELATRKLQDINSAYEAIKKSRGIR